MAACQVEGCEKAVHARGWCGVHYQSWYRHGDPLISLRVYQPGRTCSIEGCSLPHSCKGLCATHYASRDPHRARAMKYGMTAKELDAFLDTHHYQCDICGDPGTDIDHDHNCCPGERSCGQCIRGLLCHRHNVHLHRLSDDPSVTAYLTAYTESRV